jgi:hypothetical protein
MDSLDFTDVSTVISLLPVPLIEQKPGLVPAEYILRAVRNPMKEVEVLNVYRARFPVYVDEHRPAIVVPEPSDRVAAAICRDYKVTVSHYSPDEAEPGLFWVSGKFSKMELEGGLEPKISQAIEVARRLQVAWFKRLVNEADDNWNKYKMRRMISDIERLAAVCLGLEKEWNIDTMVERSLAVCKFCRSQVSNEAIVCPQCHGILNIERAKKEFRTYDSLHQEIANG